MNEKEETVKELNWYYQYFVIWNDNCFWEFIEIEKILHLCFLYFIIRDCKFIRAAEIKTSS